MITVTIMTMLNNKASNGLIKVGKFHDTFFMGVDENGNKQVSVVKVIGWVVLLEILEHTIPLLFVLVLIGLVAVGIGGGPKLWQNKEGQDNVVEGSAVRVS